MLVQDLHPWDASNCNRLGSDTCSWAKADGFDGQQHTATASEFDFTQAVLTPVSISFPRTQARPVSPWRCHLSPGLSGAHGRWSLTKKAHGFKVWQHQRQATCLAWGALSAKLKNHYVFKEYGKINPSLLLSHN